jgi:3-hydroxyisobutyrate dehydrogenase
MRCGFIGLGAMGAPMARNLHKAGLLAGVWNRTAARAEALSAELGLPPAPTIADLARRCEVLVLCVSADADVLAVVEAAAPALAAGSLVIDCSTVSADTARRAGSLLRTRGVAFLDVPVSGGVEGAQKGTLAMMAGGEATDFERAQPVLAALGRAVTHFGPQGAGQAAKATNQIMVAGIIRAIAEGLAFAQAQGLALDKVIGTLGQGAASSWYLINRGPFMERGSYPAGFRVRLHAKDLGICRDMARAAGGHLPVVDAVLDEYRQLIEAGHGDEDISALFRLKTALFAGGPGGAGSAHG